MTFREFVGHVFCDLLYVPSWWFRRHWRRLLIRWIRARERWLRTISPTDTAAGLRGRCVICRDPLIPLSLTHPHHSEHLGGWVCEDCIPAWVRAKGHTRTMHWLRTGSVEYKTPVRELDDCRGAANVAEMLASYRRNPEPSQDLGKSTSENGNSRQVGREPRVDPLATWVEHRYGEVTP